MAFKHCNKAYSKVVANSKQSKPFISIHTSLPFFPARFHFEGRCGLAVRCMMPLHLLLSDSRPAFSTAASSSAACCC